MTVGDDDNLSMVEQKRFRGYWGGMMKFGKSSGGQR